MLEWELKCKVLAAAGLQLAIGGMAPEIIPEMVQEMFQEMAFDMALETEGKAELETELAREFEKETMLKFDRSIKSLCCD